MDSGEDFPNLRPGICVNWPGPKIGWSNAKNGLLTWCLMVKDLISMVISPFHPPWWFVEFLLLMGTDQFDQSSGSSLSPGVIPCYIPCAMTTTKTRRAWPSSPPTSSWRPTGPSGAVSLPWRAAVPLTHGMKGSVGNQQILCNHHVLGGYSFSKHNFSTGWIMHYLAKT